LTTEINGKSIIVCNCEQTMPLDGKALAKACGLDGLEINSQLCRSQLGNFQRAVIGDQPVVVACTQEAPLFEEVRADSNTNASLSFTNIRERAGWSEEAGAATPKIAALLAEAALDIPPTPAMTLTSRGTTLIYGRDEKAIAAARQLAGRLDVTVLLTEPGDIPPPSVVDVPIFRGTIKGARGRFGAFELAISGYAAAVPSSRASLAFEDLGHDASSTCDLILDLSGGTPLFPAHEKRDGYVRPDPGNPAEVQKALFDLVDLVGEFDKPRYVTFTDDLCAHSRSQITGCTRCLDVCPASAIQPTGDHVAIDPFICGGCGNCAAVCPTGASTYAMPRPESLLQRLSTLLATYLGAGGQAPVVLVHDTRYGVEMIDMMARHGRGLPARVLPFAVNQVAQTGIDFFAAALAYGAAAVRILVDSDRQEELEGLSSQIELIEAVAEGLGYGAGRVAVVDAKDPETVEGELYAIAPGEPPAAGSFLPMGGKRALTMLGLRHLHRQAPTQVDILPLPAGAPFGAIEVDNQGCTLCLSCVGACPTGAILDNPDTPQLSFNEDACIQCGLCRATCPEKVMTLVPRLNFTEQARGAVVLHEEEPFACVRCGTPFATRSSVERVVAQLQGHSMFANEAAINRIRMCQDCRVLDQYEAGGDPFARGERPLPRTTDDYLQEREEALQEERKRLREEAKAAIEAGEAGKGADPTEESGD